ncbi:MAG: 50S ribosomal protein L3 [Deltaproteobacteria bacterium]|nr:50S ribosomal protein L3 [Deltaproteobacteria bacterium]
MSQGLIGKKLGMTRLFMSEGNSIPVTVIEAGPVRVVQLKTKKRDGYEALQLGFGQKRKPNKPEIGHANKTGFQGGYKILKEFKPGEGVFVEGQTLTLALFSPGEKISVTGTSKGRGYAGVMKRHGFGGGRATHGCLTPRGAGSIGCSSDPSRVFPGKRMAGHYGCARVTVKNLVVVDVRPEYGVILVKGAVPGPNGGPVYLKKSPKLSS